MAATRSLVDGRRAADRWSPSKTARARSPLAVSEGNENPSRRIEVCRDVRIPRLRDILDQGREGVHGVPRATIDGDRLTTEHRRHTSDRRLRQRDNEADPAKCCISATRNHGNPGHSRGDGTFGGERTDAAIEADVPEREPASGNQRGREAWGVRVQAREEGAKESRGWRRRIVGTGPRAQIRLAAGNGRSASAVIGHPVPLNDHRRRGRLGVGGWRWGRGDLGRTRHRYRWLQQYGKNRYDKPDGLASGDESTEHQFLQVRHTQDGTAARSLGKRRQSIARCSHLRAVTSRPVETSCLRLANASMFKEGVRRQATWEG